MSTIEITINSTEALRDYLLEHVNEIREKAVEEIFPTVRNKIKQINRDAVDQYYEAYTPQAYRRTESLYKAYRIRKKKAGFDLLVGGEFIPDSHRVSSEYIYDVMYKKGYHGGAPHNNSYYWRFPGPTLAKELGIPRYIAWYPFGPAPQTQSPYEVFKREWDEYRNGEGKKLLTQAEIRALTGMINDIGGDLIG